METSPTRAYPRFAVDADIEIRAGASIGRGRTANVSRGGLCVEVDLPIPAGVDVDVGIRLVFDDKGHSEPLVLPARTVWSTRINDRHQLGCRFRVLSAKDAAFLEMFLRYLEGSRDEVDEPVRRDDPFDH